MAVTVKLTEPREQVLVETPVGFVVLSWDKLGERSIFYVTPAAGFSLADPGLPINNENDILTARFERGDSKNADVYETGR
jgi:hypothetical protein